MRSKPPRPVTAAKSRSHCSVPRLLYLLGACTLCFLGYVSLRAAAALLNGKRSLLRTSAYPTASDPRRAQGASVELTSSRNAPAGTGADAKAEITADSKPAPAPAASADSDSMKSRLTLGSGGIDSAADKRGFPFEPGCFPLGGEPHAENGPRLLECTQVHPDGCVPKSQSSEFLSRPTDEHDRSAYEVITITSTSPNVAARGIRMMASSNLDEVISHHIRSSNDVVCPADLVEELTKAEQEGRHEVLLDIGSNIGSCAVLALKLGHSVMAFEPGSENAKLWRRNVLLNRDLYPKHVPGSGKPRPFAVLLPLAVAETVSELSLLLDPGNTGNAMVLDLSKRSVEDYFPGQGLEAANAETEKVCIVSIDSLYTRAALRQQTALFAPPSSPEDWALDPHPIIRMLDAASLVKIDIQGHEVKAFRGMAKYLRDNKKAHLRRKRVETGRNDYKVELLTRRLDDVNEPSLTSYLPKLPMLAPPPAPKEEELSPGIPPLPKAYGHLRTIFFELSMEIVYRKGDAPETVLPTLLKMGYGITQSRDNIISQEEFNSIVDLSEAGHNHNPSASLDLKASRLDLLYADGV